MKLKAGDMVRCNPEEPEYCDKTGQTGEVISILEGYDTWGHTIHVKVKFDDNRFLFFHPNELEPVI